MDITLEEFEIFAIARLKGIPYLHSLVSQPYQITKANSPLSLSFTVLTNIYSLFERSLPPSQLAPLLALQAKSHIPLSSNTARNMPLDEERRADELGHWILRLAFCRSPDLREKFVRCETELFKWRFESDDRFERSSFLKSLDLDWESVDGAEQQVYAAQLRACMPWGTKDEQFRSESWFKVKQNLPFPYLPLSGNLATHLTDNVHCGSLFRSHGIQSLISWRREESSSKVEMHMCHRVYKSAWCCKLSNQSWKEHWK